MIKIENEHVFCFDVDSTIIDHGAGIYRVTCPWLGDSFPVMPNLNNIRLLKEKKARGYFTVVWSQGGAKYAEAVINRFDLSQYVDLIITKPIGLVDDLPAETWMPKPIWIAPDERYKR